MDTLDDELVTRPISKHTIPAAGAPKVETSAPNSVFALGGGVNIDAAHAEPAQPKTPVPRALAVPRDRAIETIRACGGLNKEQFASALNLSNAQAQKLLMKLQAEGAIKGKKVKGELTRYDVVALAPGHPATPFKNWLQRQGEPRAESRKANKRSTVVQIEPARASIPPEDEGFVCGLLNTGELMLEVDGKSTRLTKARTRALVAYLDKIATSLDQRSAA